MKPIIFLLLQLLIPTYLLAQNPDSALCQQIFKIQQLVQEKIPVRRELFTATDSEYFVWDITLDGKGNLLKVDLICKENSKSKKIFNDVAAEIRSNWETIEVPYLKIFIPLILTFFDNTDYEKAENNVLGNLALADLLKNTSKINSKILVVSAIHIYFTDTIK